MRPQRHVGRGWAGGAGAEGRGRLAAAGLGLDVEGGTTCCYAGQDKVWATDPDGNRWEVFVVLEADAAVHSKTPVAVASGTEAACCAPSCCAESVR